MRASWSGNGHIEITNTRIERIVHVGIVVSVGTSNVCNRSM